MSAVTVLSSPWAAIADSAQSIWTLTDHGPHMCVNWNELQYLACATTELQPVATRLPGVWLPLVIQREVYIPALSLSLSLSLSPSEYSITYHRSSIHITTQKLSTHSVYQALSLRPHTRAWGMRLTITNPLLTYLSSSPFRGEMKARLLMACVGDPPLESAGVLFPGIWHTLSPLELNTCMAP